MFGVSCLEEKQPEPFKVIIDLAMFGAAAHCRGTTSRNVLIHLDIVLLASLKFLPAIYIFISTLWFMRGGLSENSRKSVTWFMGDPLYATRKVR